jgi:hypothetical protein
VRITTFDVNGGQRNVFAGANKKAHHVVVFEAVCVERVV